MTALVLIHSPIVGPSTWRPVANELAARSLETAVPDLRTSAAGGPHWRRHAQAAAAAITALRGAAGPMLVGHSGAGALLPAIRAVSGRRVSGYIFVDAAVPDGVTPVKGTGAFASYLGGLHASGQRYPNWTEADLLPLVPDQVRRRALLEEMRPQPPGFWDEVVPLFEGWPDAPCGYLRFRANPAYEEESGKAQARHWPYRVLEGDHFHMLVDPAGVAVALLALVADMERLAVHAGD